MRFVVRRLVAAGILFAIANLANALTLAEIEQEYARKHAKIGTYRMEYTSSTEIQGAGQAGQPPKTLLLLLKSKSAYRLDLSIFPEEGEVPDLFTIQADDGDQHRSVSFNPEGVAKNGTVDYASPSASVYSLTTFTPIGLAGLHDSATAADAGSAVFMSDLRALASDPQSKLVNETVSLDGEKAYVVEWPTEGVHPRMRFWISVDKNLALLKYESYDLNNGNQAQTRLLNSDFLEVAPGLHLPQSAAFQVLPAVDGDGRQTTTIRLKSFALNVVVTPAEFRLEIPAGVQIYDKRLGMVYTTGLVSNLEVFRRSVAGIFPEVPAWILATLAALALGGVAILFRYLTRRARHCRN